MLMFLVMLLINGASCSLCLADNCPRDKPFCSPVGCVYDCPEDFYINGTDCVLDCNEWFTSNRHCVKTCPASTFVKETLKRFGLETYLEKKCVQSCYGEYMYNGYCVNACPEISKFINDMYCVKACPPEKRFKENFEIRSITYTRCVDRCGWKAYEENNVCTDKCSDHKVISNSSCLDECPLPQQQIDNGVCVAFCPSSTVYIKNKVCLKTCPDEKPVLYNGSCVEMCPQGFSYTEEKDNNRYCIKNCTSEKYTFNGTCIKQCPKTYFAEGYSCVQKCDQKNPFIFNKPLASPKGCTFDCNVDFILTCVNSCPPKSFIQGSLCVNICPHTMYVFRNSCVPVCPELLQLARKESVTIKVWEESYYSNHLKLVSRSKEIQKCVLKCKENEVVFNGSCLKSCPSTHIFITNGVCSMEQCNTKYMQNTTNGIVCTDSCNASAVISERYCLKHCPETKHKYGNTCVVTCPVNKQYVQNKTVLSDCRNYWYYETRCENVDVFTECTVKCPENSTFVYNSTCLQVCPRGMVTFETSCMKNCPISHPLKEPWTILTKTWSKMDNYFDRLYELKNTSVQTTRCVDKCVHEEYPFNPLTKNCVEACPANAQYILHNTCVKSCPNGMILNTVKMGTLCVDECSDAKPLFKGQCLDKCPLYNNKTMHIYDKKCVQGCPVTHPFGLTVEPFLCIKTCSPGFAFRDGECIENSACIDPYFVNNHLCVKTCPSGYFWYNECLPIWCFCVMPVTTVLLIAVLTYCSRSLLKDSRALLLLMFSQDKRERFFANEEFDTDKYWNAPSNFLDSSNEINIPLLSSTNENENSEYEDSADDAT